MIALFFAHAAEARRRGESPALLAESSRALYGACTEPCCEGRALYGVPAAERVARKMRENAAPGLTVPRADACGTVAAFVDVPEVLRRLTRVSAVYIPPDSRHEG